MTHANPWRMLGASALALLVWITGWEWATLMAAAELTVPSQVAAQVFGHAVYWPWEWMLWSESAAELAAVDLAGYGTLFATLAIVVIARVTSSESKRSDAYGSAKWGGKRDLERAGLSDHEGVVLAQTADAKYALKSSGKKFEWRMKRPGSLLLDPGAGHILCAAPTRSGKGIGLVIPTLLSWRDSVLVYDIKKELWHFTAGWRRKFSYVWRFEPSSETSLRYNPLFEIPRGPGDVRQAQNIADILIDPNGDQEKRDHWQKTACDLLVGAILHVLYAGPRRSLAGVLELLSDPTRDHEQILRLMMATNHLGEGPHPQVVVAARGVLNKHPNERSGVFSTALSCLGIYLDPVIARNTDESDFRPAQLNSLDRPVSLYLVVPPSDADRLRPLVRLVLNQVGKRLTESMEHAPSKPSKPKLMARLRNALRPPVSEPTQKRHRLLFLIDEFPTLGRLPLFENALAFAAGYGIKFFLVAQSLNQIERVYGPNHSFLDNSAVRVVYAANDERTAKRISDMLGQRTEVNPRKTHTRRGLFADSVSEANSEHGRPLLTPGEVLTLPFDEALIFVNGAAPYRAKKVMYYQDARFQDRAGLPTPDRPEEQAAELPAVRTSDWTSAPSAAAGSSMAAPLTAAVGKDGAASPPTVIADAASSTAGKAETETVGAALAFDGHDAVAQAQDANAAEDDEDDGRETRTSGSECTEEVVPW